MEQKHLLPVGKECLLPTRSEAENAFAACGHFGEISLVLARFRTEKPEPELYIGPKRPRVMLAFCWNCADTLSGNVILPAFDYQDDLQRFEHVHMVLTLKHGHMLVFEKQGYLLCHEELSEGSFKLEDDIIKKIECYPDERSVMRLAGLFGLKAESAVLYKLNSLRDGEINFWQKKCEDYISVAWKVRCGKENFWSAAFPEDEIMFSLYDFNAINWTPLGEGQGFIRNKIYYSVGYDDQKGFYFQEGITLQSRSKAKIISLYNKEPS